MDLNQYIQHPELLGRETLYNLRSYVAMYPCHQTARLLMLRNLYILHDATFDAELRAAAFYITDRTALFNLAEAGYYKLSPAKAPAPARTGETAPSADRSAAPEGTAGEHRPSVIDATTDYMSYMMSLKGGGEKPRESEESKSASDLINSFLERHGGRITIQEIAEGGGNVPHEEVAFENDKDDLEEDFYTESLAKVYVKQGNYTKALEIFRRLNLNSSEKSAYFADQMRFLEKVIAAQPLKREEKEQ